MIKLALLALKLAATVILLTLVFWRIDLTDTVKYFHAASTVLLGTAVAQLALQPVIGSLRWHIIVRGLGGAPTIRQSLSWTYVAGFLNQVLPGAIGGDAVRIWLAYRAGHMMSRAFSAVALDRLFTVSALAAISVACALLLSKVRGLEFLWMCAIPILIAAALALAALVSINRLLRYLPQARFIRTVASVAMQIRGLFKVKSAGPLLLALAFVGCINIFVSLFLFARAFHVQVNGWELAVAIPPVILASSIPVSIGGWGTREFTMIAILAVFGVVPEQALAASIAFGLAGILVNLPGLLVLLLPIPDSRRDENNSTVVVVTTPSTPLEEVHEPHHSI